MVDSTRYPNLDGTLGSTVPLITSLLTSASLALAIVPLTTTVNGGDVTWFGRPADVASLVFSSAATGILLAATLMSVFAHASSVGSASSEHVAILKAAAADQVLETDPTERQRKVDANWGALEAMWRRRTLGFYEAARTCWLVGFACFLLGLGLLGSTRAVALLPACAVLAILATLPLLSAGWGPTPARLGQRLGAVLLLALAVFTGLKGV